MGRCKNAELLHKVGVPKLADWMEVTFSLMSDINNCVSINTRDYTSIGSLNYYAMYDRPANQWDCNGGICTTTGTLYVGTGGDSEGVVFYKRFDATDYAAGVITAYISGAASGDIVKVYVSDASTFSNADVYNYTLGDAADDGYAPVLIDLSATPTSTVGDGWTASENGVYVKVEVLHSSANIAFGISTISFYTSLYDLVVNDVVKISCLSEVGGSFDVSALEDTCLSSGYDETSLDGGIDQTITGKLMTSNYWMLNPLLGRNRYAGMEDSTTGYRIETVKKTISSGTVTLDDLYMDECEFITVQVDDKCTTPVSDLLHRINSPVQVTLAYDQYQVLNDTSTGISTFYFNTELNGLTVLISYPQKVTLKERMVADPDNIGEVRVRMSYPRILADGTEEIHTFNNVLITSFPSSITNEESEFSFTINIHRDSNNEWFNIQRVQNTYSDYLNS